MTTNHILFYTTSFHTISTNLLASQSFGLTEDQPHAYWSTPEVEPIPSTQPNEPKCAGFALPNEELDPFSDDDDEILCN